MILAFQHHKTFTERLEGLPVKVEYLNRFRSTKTRNEILQKLESGEIDIIIGTHQLVNKNVKYKDLGLLIMDEEHKFGVGVKDKLKTLRANIDTLTLDRKSTRLNSSHVAISYAVFCLKKKPNNF